MKAENANDLYYYLPMADDSCWRVKACDPRLAPFVARYAAVCSMGVELPGTPEKFLSCHVDSFANLESFRQKHPDLIETGRRHYFRIFFDPSFENSFMFYNLEEFRTKTMQTLAVNNIGSAFQLQMVGRENCAPCHCALVTINGRGAVIGGRGDSGKTTCARRLPKPHRVLADDYALLFEHQGRLLAQAMPTWSNLTNGNTDYKADCSLITEVATFFFMRQSRDDSVVPINGIEAVTNMNAVLQDLLCVRILSDMPDSLKAQLRNHIFDFAGRIVNGKPIGMLYASLHGNFWHTMESFLNAG